MFDFKALTKYLLEGLAVAVAAFFIPQKKNEVSEIVLIALTAAAIFAVLDHFTPEVAGGARQGAGFGIGLNQVGWGRDSRSIQGGGSYGGADRVRKYTTKNLYPYQNNVNMQWSCVPGGKSLHDVGRWRFSTMCSLP